MGEMATATPGTLPPDTFAKLAPGLFLHAHLKQASPVRPSGRKPDELREPTVNTGSLSHSNGSALVRLGDTSIVCGVRAELLSAADIPRPPSENTLDEDLVEELGLLVPNIELSTGCAPAYLPGNPPSNVAQSLSWRMSTLLHSTNLIDSKDLTITYTEPELPETEQFDEPQTVVKGYWTLYIDVLCISLDGNCFDAAWIAVMAALRTTTLPKAYWDADQEAILCSPLAADAQKLSLRSLPMPTSFAVFTTGTPLKPDSEAENWVLADPDGFEEDACRETLTVVVDNGKLVKVEKHGGICIDRLVMSDCVAVATRRWKETQQLLGSV